MRQNEELSTVSIQTTTDKYILGVTLKWYTSVMYGARLLPQYLHISSFYYLISALIFKFISATISLTFTKGGYLLSVS
jgi:hypothetical protein